METGRRYPTFAYFFLIAFLFLLLFGNAQSAMQGVRQGLMLCTKTLIPALFPFLVLSELFVCSSIGERLGRVFCRPVSRLLGISEAAASAILLGVLCGQPIAAASAASYCNTGEISRKELHRLMLFANVPGGGFLINAVGCILLGNKAAGIWLFFSTLFSSLIVGICLRIFAPKNIIYEKKPPNGMRNVTFLTDLTGSIKRAFFTLLQICAFLLFFCAIGYAVCDILEAYNTPPLLRVFVLGTLEMTSGVTQAAVLLSPETAFRCAAFLSGFAGLSVCLQIFSIAEQQHPPLLPYLLSKLVQGILTLCLCEIYLRVFSPDFSPMQSTPAFSAATIPIPWITAFLLCVLFTQRIKTKKGT